MSIRDWLEAALSSAEDPQERIRALVRDLRARQAKGRAALALTIKLEKQLLDDLVAAEDASREGEARSKDALARGDAGAAEEEAARLLGLQKREAGARAQWKEQREVADRVRKAVAEAARRTEEVAHAHTVMLARAHCAEATRAIVEALELLDSPAVQRSLEKQALQLEERERAT